MKMQNEVVNAQVSKRFEEITQAFKKLPEAEQKYVAGVIAGLSFMRSTQKKGA